MLFISALITLCPAILHAYSILKQTILVDVMFTGPAIHPLVIITSLIVLFTLLIARLLIITRNLKRLNNSLLNKDNYSQSLNEDLKKQIDFISKMHIESEIFYEMLLQSADDGISFYDSSWNLKYANKAFYSIIGFDKAEYVTLDPDNLIHPDDKDYHTKRIRALNETGYFESDLRLHHKKGHYIHLSTKSVLVKTAEGSVLGSLTISRDISVFKQTLNDLVKANEVAEASNKLKASFLANISHEIRTPLNSVVGFSNLLLADDVTKELREEYIEHINYNSEKLLQIIGDIIDLSRLESSQIEIRYEETSINSLIDEIALETSYVIKRNEKPILLNVRNSFRESGDFVFTDRIWLKRVLNHLLDNAVKFTLDGSIDLICALEEDLLTFTIKDTGIGINKENLTRIFEEFRQEVDGHQRPFEGLGVGLTLAKEVVERMGGKITVQSEKGMGSEFGFSLPYRPAGSIRLNIEKTGTGANHGGVKWDGKKCLLIDSNKDVLLYVKRILSDSGITVLTSRSGNEALQLIRFTPDISIVILDMQMPEIDGIAITREIRSIRADLPIIAHTAFIFEGDKDIIMEAGCDACLIKPIRRESLLSAMKTLLK
ncbi:MAG TPA: ATP-binding protein [Bacteroidales bacterium]|nr:ATP-binding protein [Bacteroidales bacterium]